MSKIKGYHFKQRIIVKETINCILQVIRDNKNIELELLLAKLHVNPPFIIRKKALDYLGDLGVSGLIKIKDGKVSSG